MTITPFSRRDLIPLAMILLIAAFMRFGRAEIVEYFHDDGMLATLAQEMANGQAFHLTGILSSTGIPNPPTSIYALLPFFWISRDPVFAIYGIMALNMIGVGLLWAIAHRYFGQRVALSAIVLIQKGHSLVVTSATAGFSICNLFKLLMSRKMANATIRKLMTELRKSP